MNEQDSDHGFSLVPYGSRELALSDSAQDCVLAEMVESSLALARESAVVQPDLVALASVCFIAAQLTENLGREPTDEELAEKLGRSVVEVSELKTAAIRLVSFETLIIPQIYEDSPEYNCKLATVDWYWRAAQLGHARAQLEIAFHYRDGSWVQQDHTEAVKWFRRAAEQGDADAQFNLGKCYWLGHGVIEDDAEKAKWYRKAAEQGNVDAQNYLWTCYYHGDGVERDETEGLVWLRRAAVGGHPVAQCNMAHHVDGDVEAANWLRKSADQGFAVAQEELGKCYETGCGVTQDWTEAAAWYRRAGSHGSVSFAKLQLEGMGVPKNTDEAIRVFKTLADQDIADAQYNLGLCYLHGKGVQRNPDKACQYFARASWQEDEAAANELKLLMGSNEISDTTRRIYRETLEYLTEKEQNDSL